jgi:transcriptional regulator with XRE-family HTH domain
MTQLNPNDQANLLFGDAQPIADYLGVSIKTVKRWKSGIPMPTAAFKLMQVRFGDLSGLLGAEWEGFTFGRQLDDPKLYLPGWRGGFEPYAIRAMFFQVQQVRALEAQIREAKRREEILETDKADALNQAAQYPRLLMLESHMEMMLERISV